jgi:class 3 adenylate cyclase/tetratricopeptide (TPR) repeat protein
MAICPNCAAENPERAKFCLECGTSLAVAGGSAGGARKLVTILFADVVGSTALGERLDPETLRALLTRYFAAARRGLERHGGTVEKFIGDAVMAVFGIPMLHEDDALRGVRAAVELRDAISELNDQLSAERGLRIEFRIGVNSGEVVAGGRDGNGSVVTGDAVNVAARLEQNAPPSEILIGETTYRLTRDYILAERVEPISAKGKSESVTAYRLLGMADSVTGQRRADAPFVGRRRELSRLVEAYEDAGTERRCFLFTLLGTAGVGKSRLVAEFTERVGSGASVVRGRCLPYGDGITFWPIAEIVRILAGVEEKDDAGSARERLFQPVAAAPDAERIRQMVATAIGLSEDSASKEELFWGIRRWLESQAGDQPLVCIIEDIHWAEPTLLDLLEHVADWTRDASILLLCTARPELLEVRPTWGGGKVNASTLLLEPLSADLTKELVEALVKERGIPPGVIDRILDTAEGNPLFAGEIVRMLLDEGAPVFGGAGEAGTQAGQEVPIPRSVQAVIAARLDRLPGRERSVAERAAVAGRVFERGAVLALVPDDERDSVPQSLLALVRKELVDPDRSELTVDEAFRFRHLLIRDTAYEALPKHDRAELHERFAKWVEQAAGERAAEYGEIIGYHYEQAQRYRRELGLDDDRTSELAGHAGDRLAAAGRNAYLRRDAPAAIKLLTRAIPLVPPGPARRHAMQTLAITHMQINRFVDALPVLDTLRQEAESAGDLPAAWKARLLAHDARTWTDPSHPIVEGEVIAQQATPFFEATQDGEGFAIAAIVLGNTFLGLAQWAAAIAAYDRGLQHTAAVDPVLEELLREQVVNAAVWGPITVDEFLSVVDREYGRSRSELARGSMQAQRALGLAMAGQPDLARQDAAEGISRIEALIGVGRAAVFTSGVVEYVIGDLAAADEAFARTSAIYEAQGETGSRSTIAGFRALTKLELDHELDEIVALAEQCRDLAAINDAASQVVWRQVLALVAAREGRLDEAHRLIEEATSSVDETDFLYLKGLVARDRGRIAEMVGDKEAAAESYRLALSNFEQKGDVVDAQRIRDALLALG